MKANITRIPNEDRSVFHISLHVGLIIYMSEKEGRMGRIGASVLGFMADY